MKINVSVLLCKTEKLAPGREDGGMEGLIQKCHLALGLWYFLP